MLLGCTMSNERFETLERISYQGSVQGAGSMAYDTLEIVGRNIAGAFGQMQEYS